MHLKIRNSSLKGRKKKGFRRRMRTKGGRAVLSRQRRRESGKGKKRGYKKSKR
jgi:large subunit ribosomal protein L34